MRDWGGFCGRLLYLKKCTKGLRRVRGDKKKRIERRPLRKTQTTEESRQCGGDLDSQVLDGNKSAKYGVENPLMMEIETVVDCHNNINNSGGEFDNGGDGVPSAYDGIVMNSGGSTPSVLFASSINDTDSSSSDEDKLPFNYNFSPSIGIIIITITIITIIIIR